MKKAFVLLVLIFVIAIALGSRTSSVVNQAPSVSQGPKPAVTKVEAPVIKPRREPAASPADSLPGENSVNELSGAIAGSINTSSGLKDLLNSLKKSGQEPFVVRDRNPDSGEMLIVRTKSPLDGTRYFHAQYFTDASGEAFIQHASFEFKPGEQAMQTAIRAVERNFSNLSRPVVQREGYVKWKLGDDYIVWVKKMDLNDLKEDPFNSYSLADEGTIRVAVEQEIHD